MSTGDNAHEQQSEITEPDQTETAKVQNLAKVATNTNGNADIVTDGAHSLEQGVTSPATNDANSAQITLRMWRGDDSGGEFVDYQLPQLNGEVVLDAVHRAQAEQAPDLAVRWNCKAGKCGSCSAEINGKPRLMCMTRMSTIDTTKPITVSPMRGFPIIRDLVTDVSFNYAVARKIPALQLGPKPADGVYRMAQADVERSQEFRKCIECYLCQNVCHVIRDHEENKEAFAGPRFFIRLAELEMHPLDTLDRRRYTSEAMGIGLCNITKCCTEVCPEQIHITDNAIIPMKERIVDARFDPVAWLGRKIMRKPSPTPANEITPLTPAGRTGEVIVTGQPPARDGSVD